MLLAVQWTYKCTGEQFLLDMADKVAASSSVPFPVAS